MSGAATTSARRWTAPVASTRYRHGGQVLCSDLTATAVGRHSRGRAGRPRRASSARSPSAGRLAARPIEEFSAAAFGCELAGELADADDRVRRAARAELRSIHEAPNRRGSSAVGWWAGKTRLALQFAAEAQPGFRHGAWLCDLAPLTSSDAVGPLVADVVGVEPGADGEWFRRLLSVGDPAVLLVLDNCEHVLDAAATLADAIVRGCPEVVVLATSREGLGVAGERIIAVGSLALPRVDDPPTLCARPMRSACSCPGERRATARPLMTTRSGRSRRCAAGSTVSRSRSSWRPRVRRSLSVTEIARHLDDRFQLLTRGARTASVAIRRCGRRSIGASIFSVTPNSGSSLGRAVFAGGFTLDAAAAVCEPGTIDCDRDARSCRRLVRRSMLIAEEDATRTRYRMLETIRQYAAERLEADRRRGEKPAGRTSTGASASPARPANSSEAPTTPPRFTRWNVSSTTSELLCTSPPRSAISTPRRRCWRRSPIGALWDTRLGASMAALARDVAPILGEPDHPVSAALLSLLALDAALRFAAGDEAVELAERACVIARRHDVWLLTGPWLAWLLSSLTAGRHEMIMVTAHEALTRAIADDDAFAVAEWDAQLGIAHWMAGDVEEAQRLTETGLCSPRTSAPTTSSCATLLARRLAPHSRI